MIAKLVPFESLMIDMLLNFIAIGSRSTLLAPIHVRNPRRDKQSRHGCVLAGARGELRPI